MQRGFFTCVLAILPIVLGGFAAGVVEAKTRGVGQPIRFAQKGIVDNNFIVQYHPEVDDATRIAHESMVHAIASRRSGHRGIIRTYAIGEFKGYHVELHPADAVELKKYTGIIKGVTQDELISIGAAIPLAATADEASRNKYRSNISPDLGKRAQNATNLPTNTMVESAGSWGQARVSTRQWNYTQDQNNLEYHYLTGETTAYVIDTGIKLNHSEFYSSALDTTPRARWGGNFVGDGTDDDLNGHGTHVAGTIAGLVYGMAPLTKLVACKVFDESGSGSWSGVIAAVNFACADAAQRKALNLSVINMSLGGSRCDPLDDAVAACMAQGMSIVAAAGNANQDVSTSSPAAVPGVIAVGSIGEEDAKSGFSNYGAGLTVFAPGEWVKSSWIDSEVATAELSGTSMASPHVAGLVSYLMQQYGPHSPDQMKQRLTGMGTTGMITGLPEGTPNLIAFNGGWGN